MMKFIAFIILVIAIGCFIFWDDLFTDSANEIGKSDGIIFIDETLDQDIDEIENNGARGAHRSETPVTESSHIDNVHILIGQERWQDALELLESRKTNGSLSDSELVLLYQCLSHLGRGREMTSVLQQLFDRPLLSKNMIDAAFSELERLDSNVGKRALLGKMVKGFGLLENHEVDKVIAVTSDLNRMAPESLSGLYNSENYTIQPNDSLWKVSREYNRRKKLNVEVGVIRFLNGIKGNRIHPGRSIKLPTEKITIKVWKKSWMLCVFLGDTLIAAYKVGLGKDGSTPTGEFIVENKLENPFWRGLPPEDPENILGSRWLGFKDTLDHQGYGIHGTKNPESIGKNMSEGCIRLRNDDVESLFELVASGTVVEIL